VGGLGGLSRLGLGCFRVLWVSSRRRCVVVICGPSPEGGKTEAEGRRDSRKVRRDWMWIVK